MDISHSVCMYVFDTQVSILIDITKFVRNHKLSPSHLLLLPQV